MFLSKFAGYGCLVQTCCSVSHYIEATMLKRKAGQSLAKWQFQVMICCYRTLCDIVTNNGKMFIKALEILHKQYNVPVHHIRISGYNLKAQGIVERSHLDICNVLFAMCNDNENSWFKFLNHTI